MGLRLRSDIWVKAYIRLCGSTGTMAAVVRHGDDDAGAIFIKVNRLDGTCALFGPAPAGLDEADRSSTAGRRKPTSTRVLRARRTSMATFGSSRSRLATAGIISMTGWLHAGDARSLSDPEARLPRRLLPMDHVLRRSRASPGCYAAGALTFR